MVYAIYEDFYLNVEKKLNRIAKKCIKHGNDFIFKVNGEEIREKYNEDTGRTEYHKFILVEVEGTAKINDWECIAVLEVNNYGNIIRRINTDIDIPERFKNSEDICEHCNTKRHRNNLYIIHNTKTNEWKQVGGNCLNLYTNGLNLEYVTAYMDGITELEENNRVFGIGGKPYFSVKEILSYAIEVIARTGYYNAQSNLPTKYLVGQLARLPLDKAIEEINIDLTNAKSIIRFSKEDFFKNKTEAMVEKIIDYYKHLEDNSEFVHNIHVMLNEEYILPKNFGFITYLPEGYNRFIQKEIERIKKEEANAKTEYFGKIGERYKDKDIQFVNLITSWETQWGTTYVYKITLIDGEILTWKTNNGLYLYDNEKFDKISFTVKEHKEYKGEKQTEITRCKITKKNMAE